MCAGWMDYTHLGESLGAPRALDIYVNKKWQAGTEMKNEYISEKIVGKCLRRGNRNRVQKVLSFAVKSPGRGCEKNWQAARQRQKEHHSRQWEINQNKSVNLREKIYTIVNVSKEKNYYQNFRRYYKKYISLQKIIMM